MPLIRLLQALAALLVLATALLLAHLATTAVVELRRTASGQLALDRLQLTLRLTEMASRERGPANALLGDELPLPLEQADALTQARARTDAALDALEQHTWNLPAPQRPAASGRAALVRARAQVDALLARPRAARTPAAIRAAVQAMVALIPLYAPETAALAAAAQAASPDAGDDVQAALLAAQLREYAGLLGSQFTAALASAQPLTAGELTDIAHTRGRIDELGFLITLRVAGATQPALAAQAWSVVQARFFERALRLAADVVDASARGAHYGLDPAAFAARYVPDLASILDFRDVLLAQAGAHAAAAHARALSTLAGVSAGGAALLLALLLAIGVMQRRVLHPLAEVAKAVRALAHNDLDIRLPAIRADDEMAAVVRAVQTLHERQQQRAALAQERDTLIAQLRELSNTDALTGLANRRGFFEAGDQVLSLARRHGFGVVAVMLDIDHFKKINDSHGHAAGDAVLYAVADAIRSQLRESDLAGRIGGEEFALLLNHCELASGVLFAERLRQALQSIELPAATAPGQAARRVTASIGLSAFGQGEERLEQLLRQADGALYHAKSTGRDRVVAGGELPTQPAGDVLS